MTIITQPCANSPIEAECDLCNEAAALARQVKDDAATRVHTEREVGQVSETGSVGPRGPGGKLIPRSRQAQARIDDALSLAPSVQITPYVLETIERLRKAGLIESVPIGAHTEGGGVLVTYTRLLLELANAYAAGKAGQS